jgi:hypothetical protein
VVFNEPLSDFEVLSTDPEFPFTTELTGNDEVLQIIFLDYTMLGGTKYTIRLRVIDLAGNETEIEYSFTTV